MSASQPPPEGTRRPRVPDLRVPPVDYVRFVALGDSASCGVGDPTPAGCRGWARILADAIATEHHVSFCNFAVPGAVVADVRREQLREALDHSPVIASLVVGLNDLLRSTWDPEQLRADLLHCAGALARHGALVITVRFHDHTRVFGMPGPLAGPRRRRIEVSSTRSTTRCTSNTATSASTWQPTRSSTPASCGPSTGCIPPSGATATSPAGSRSC